MAVALTVSETLGGAQVDDALVGGGEGVDLGPVTNGNYAPVTDKDNNEGRKLLYVRHDAVDDPITDLKIHFQQYGVGTGFTYGGAKTAVADFTDFLNEGNVSGSSKNNADGNSSGVWIDLEAGVSVVNQFDRSTRGTFVKVFGQNGGAATGEGRNLDTAFDVLAEAMVYNDAGEQLATTPVNGQIGVSGDTVLGDHAKILHRIYLRSDYPDGGYIQWEEVFSYSFTS